jgi:alkylation response protein AidB-like acyl-CoA dehydrogenase
MGSPVCCELLGAPATTMSDPQGSVRSLQAFLETRADDCPSVVLDDLVRAGLGDLPLPGGGRTKLRFLLLRTLGAHDLSLARLAEGHADALAILEEAAVPAPEGARLGVWAAGPVDELVASQDARGWQLDGRRRWCSGAPTLTHALVRAQALDGDRLFLVPLNQVGTQIMRDTWAAVGMADSLTFDVAFDGVRVASTGVVGEPDFYGSRRGFWVGSIGVAAVWLGGAEAVGSVLAAKAGEDPHRLAHLGAVAARLFGLDSLLERAERIIDEEESDVRCLERLARIVRSEVEAGATEILHRTGRATGADPLCHNAAHARRVADLTVYLRQSHGEADLAALGTLVHSHEIPARKG